MVSAVRVQGFGRSLLYVFRDLGGDSFWIWVVTVVSVLGGAVSVVSIQGSGLRLGFGVEDVYRMTSLSGETAQPQDLTVGLGLGPYGGLRGEA